MTNGSSQGIGCILAHRQPQALWRPTTAEQRKDGFLHLDFISPAVADHRGLDLRWAVLSDTQARLGCSEERHATDLAQTKGALDVIGEKGFFQTQYLWGTVVNHFDKASVDDP